VNSREMPVTEAAGSSGGASIRPRVPVARMPSAAIREDAERPGASSAAGTPITEPSVPAAAEVSP